MKIWIETNEKIRGRMWELQVRSAGYEISHTPEEAHVLLVDLDSAQIPPPFAASRTIGVTQAVREDGQTAAGLVPEGLYALLRRPFTTQDLLGLLQQIEGAVGTPWPKLTRVPITEQSPLISAGDISLSEVEQILTVGEWRIPLSRHETVICLRLLQTPGEPVSREELRGLFLTPEESDSNLADVYICHIRQKIEKTCHVRLIRTVRGKGYQIG